ncbi:MAG: SGNH/GDSL hydrolase family protein [Candidatus Azobacteroides sp.]|nr:SGNH/GDSL hydrolase family protein [Candidatus Azobacteroides sp.]
MDRRNFFKRSALTGMAMVSIPEIVKAALSKADHNEAKYTLSKGNILLFQGDSITDCGRNRKDENEANKQSQLGSGYALFAAANLLANQADKELKIYNRGISGNKVFQLADRWEKDCIHLKPDILSILIGINDFWHTQTKAYNGTIGKYETDYRNLLIRSRNELGGVKIVVCEPFIIYGGSALNNTWEQKFAPYRKVAQSLAEELELTFVPFQAVFNEALKKAPAKYWGPDGVHPSMAGTQLMAQAWLKVVL